MNTTKTAFAYQNHVLSNHTIETPICAPVEEVIRVHPFVMVHPVLYNKYSYAIMVCIVVAEAAYPQMRVCVYNTSRSYKKLRGLKNKNAGPERQRTWIKSGSVQTIVNRIFTIIHRICVIMWRFVKIPKRQDQLGLDFNIIDTIVYTYFKVRLLRVAHTMITHQLYCIRLEHHSRYKIILYIIQFDRRNLKNGSVIEILNNFSRNTWQVYAICHSKTKTRVCNYCKSCNNNVSNYSKTDRLIHTHLYIYNMYASDMSNEFWSNGV